MVKANCNYFLLVDIIKKWRCFARQKTRTKIEELRDLRIEVLKNYDLRMTNLDADIQPATIERQKLEV
ncbi:MAG: hypothetical protein ACC651_11530 [Candidatus Scalindua sp.]